MAPARLKRGGAMPPGVGLQRALAVRVSAGRAAAAAAYPVWLFDLDDTLHDCSRRVFGELEGAMTDYIVRELGLPHEEAQRLRVHYWARYGATLLGLSRHHGVQVPHFLRTTHALPGLEGWLQGHRHDIAALRRLPGRKILLTNAPLDYARRVLSSLGLWSDFDAVLGFEQMRMFGQHRPKPDTRMFRALVAALGVAARRCVLVEDTLAHQKAAHAVGIRTVWMQRWIRGGRAMACAAACGGSPAPQAGQQLDAGPGSRATRCRRRPAYVSRRVRSLSPLRRLACAAWPGKGPR